MEVEGNLVKIHMEFTKEMTHSTQKKDSKSKDSEMTQTKSTLPKDQVKEKVKQSETKMDNQMKDDSAKHSHYASFLAFLYAIGFKDKEIQKLHRGGLFKDL